MLSPLLAIVVDNFREKPRKSVVYELLYADDPVFMSETMEGLKERFGNWKHALESKGLKVNTRKTKLMVSESEGEPFQSNINPCGVVAGESWPIQCCAQNVETGFMADVQK